MSLNPMCDGTHCKMEDGEVKLYPVGGGGNLILCVVCWANENRHNFNRGQEQSNPEDWPQHNWFHAETYESNEMPDKSFAKAYWNDLGIMHKK